jgi:excisionase family DNA binding protein
MNDLLTTHQVQEILRVDRTTIYRMVDSGRLPAIRVGKQWRFSRPEIERWLQTQSAQTQQSPDGAPAQPVTDQPPPAQPGHLTVQPGLHSILPLVCVQLIQDAFADILGVMMVVTDMQGNPVTRLSNPCGFYTALTQDPQTVAHCLRTWQDLAADPSLAPRFASSEMGLLCARGLIRLESTLMGMVVIGGIAPEAWPPTLEQLSQLAATFGQSLNTIQSNAGNVYRMDKANQQRALRSVQRIADIFSHIAGDRNELCGRLQAIAALTIL